MMQPDVAASMVETGVSTQFYAWRGHRCAYEVRASEASAGQTPLVLVHPIGVGLSRRFWDRFCEGWQRSGAQNPIYNLDLLGCGESDLPAIAYPPEIWAEQLEYFLQTVVKQGAILVVQGALFPVAIELCQRELGQTLVRGMVLSGPPAWPVMTLAWPEWRKNLSWSFFRSPLGALFYRYARRRQFLQSFSAKQLFAASEGVDEPWLAMLHEGSRDMATRHAVFAFLAGFWRKGYQEAIAAIPHPTLVVVGDTASSISRSGKQETPSDRLSDYLKHLSQGEGLKLDGRNVLPYEQTDTFVEAIAPFIARLS